MVGQFRAPKMGAALPFSRRLISLVLSLLLIASLTPVSAWADDEAVSAKEAAEAPSEEADAPAAEPAPSESAVEDQGVTVPERAGGNGDDSEPETTPDESLVEPDPAPTEAADEEGLSPSSITETVETARIESPDEAAVAAAAIAPLAEAAIPSQDDQGIYQLTTKEEVLWFFKSASASASATLCGDFDLSDEASIAKSSFSGVFDGGGHSLAINLQLSAYGSNQGLFGTNSGTIRNLTITGSVTVPVSTATTSYYHFGVIAGKNTGTIENCVNRTAITSGGGYTGAIAGYSSGKIAGCSNYGSVTCTNTSSYGYAGGIAGYVAGGTIDGCTNIGTATSTKGSGGIAGQAYYASRTTVKNCVVAKSLVPAKAAGASTTTYLLGSTSTSYLSVTNCSLYEVPVASVALEGTKETGAVLRASALGADGQDASGATFTWEASDAVDGPFSAIANAGSTGMFVIPQDTSLVGKFIRATAEADQGSAATSNVIGPIAKSDTLLVTEAKDALTIDTNDIDENNLAVVRSLDLPSQGINDSIVDWASSNEAVIGADGSLALPDAASAVTVRLTATLRVGSATATKAFDIKVHPASNPVATVVLSAGGAEVPSPLVTGTTLSATGLGANGKSATDVTYQWQYAESALAAADGRWINIEGATKQTYLVSNSYDASLPDGWKHRVLRVVIRGEGDSIACSEATPAIALSDALSITTDLKWLQRIYGTAARDLYEPCDLALPIVGPNGTTIAWRSDNADIISPEGAVTLPLGNTVRNLWVRGTITKGSASASTCSLCYHVHPIPVALEGIHIEGVAETGQTLTAIPLGNGVATPTDVEYQWEYSTNGTSWSAISSWSGGADQALTYSSSTAKFLRVTAKGIDALGQPVSFTSEALPYTYLSSSAIVKLTVAGTTAPDRIEVGDQLTASAYTSTYSWSSPATSGIAWQWLVSTTGEPGSFVPLTGCTTNTLAVDESLAGKYLQVSTRTQKGTVCQTVGQVGSTTSTAQAAIWALENAIAGGWAIEPVANKDTNMNDIVAAKLATLITPTGLDISSISVRVAAAKATSNGAYAAISANDNDTNGDLRYFFYNPSVLEPSTLTPLASYGTDFKVSFTVSDGKETLPWDYEDAVHLGWDTGRVSTEILEPCAQAVGKSMFAEGESAAAVTQNLNLPTDCGTSTFALARTRASAIFSPFVTAQWTVPYTHQSYVAADGTILSRPVNDRDVSLTGKFTFSDGVTSLSLSKTYGFTLKEEFWQPGDTAQQSLQRRIDSLYQLWDTQHKTALTAAGTGSSSFTALEDFCLSNSSHLKLAFGINDKWAFTAESSNPEVLSINEYRVNVFAPAEGEPDAEVQLTVKVFERANPSVCATKTFSITVPSFSRSDLEDEIALMQAAKDRFFEGIANGQSSDNVTGDLSSFEKVVWGDEDGTLRWIRTHSEAAATKGGLTWQLVTQGSIPDNNHYFQSSDENVVSHENMLVTQPSYDRTITIRGCLSSERFADYYEQERYRNDPVLGPLLAQLYRQPLETTFTVKGLLGEVDPDEGTQANRRVSTVAVTGITPLENNQYSQTSWVPLTEVTLGEEGDQSAWDLFQTALDAAGCSYVYERGFLNSITSADGSLTLGMTSPDGVNWAWWHFRVNGEDAAVGLAGYRPQPGDALELVYVPAAGSLVAPDIAVEPDAPVAEWESPWASFGAGVHEGVSVDGALESLEGSWSYDFAQGGYASWSEPVVAGGFVFFATNDKLLKLETATGAVVAEVQLAGTTAYGCRPVYTDGLVVVPLNGGRIQALSALTLQTKWLTATLPALEQAVEGAVDSVVYEQQALSTMTAHDGYLYAFTAAADWSQTYGGWRLCVNLANGAVRWSAVNEGAGYYWAGAAELDGYLIVAGDDGALAAVATDSTDGSIASTLDLGSAARSSVVVSDGAAYVVTTDGVLHQVVVGEGGVLAEAHRVKFADSSTSTAAVVDGVVYVGGQIGGAGVLAAIDTTAWGAPVVVFQADGAALPGDVKSTPLVVRDHRGTLVLFTCNGAVGNWPTYTGGGGVYGWRPGSTEATLLFDPPAGQHNYSMASVAFDGSRFYYVNDAGILFALSASDKAPAAPTPAPNPGEDEGPESNGAANRPEDPSNNSSGSDSGMSPNGSHDRKTAAGAVASQRGPLVPFVQLTAAGPSSTRVVLEQPRDASAATTADGTIAEAAGRANRTAISDDTAPLAADAGSPEGTPADIVDQPSTQETLAWALLLAALACATGGAYLIITARKRREEKEGPRGA